MIHILQTVKELTERGVTLVSTTTGSTPQRTPPSRLLGTSTGTLVMTPHGQLLRAWPVELGLRTEQLLHYRVAIHTHAKVWKERPGLLENRSHLLLLWSG